VNLYGQPIIQPLEWLHANYFIKTGNMDDWVEKMKPEEFNA